MSSKPFQQQSAPEVSDVEMMDVESRVIEVESRVIEVESRVIEVESRVIEVESRVIEVDENGVLILPDGAKWKGPIPIAYPQSGCSTISVPMEERVATWRRNRAGAANGVDISSGADRAKGDPLLTEYSVDTWIETMFIFIARMLGETKWRMYRHHVYYLIYKYFEAPYTEVADEDDVKKMEQILLLFLSQNKRVCYLHNDITRQTNHLPLFPDLPRVDEETKSLMKRIGDNWDRELKVKDGQLITRNEQRVGYSEENDVDYGLHCCMVAMEFLHDWDGQVPARGRSVATLLSAFGGMKM
ncbi:hypothetical protein SLS60_011664 [Paraconiothyrium brasiliense]|uniref:Uncharacterized protein n=1 Tax=Paraconiothyrium brasiliense TaxID=300254 RepID=A0ABR3QHN0_9PLEO